MGWIEYLLIVAGSSLEIFVAMECQGSLIQKVNKKQLTAICFIVAVCQLLAMYIGYFLSSFLNGKYSVKDEALLGEIISIGILIGLGIRLIGKAIRNELFQCRGSRVLITALHRDGDGIAALDAHAHQGHKLERVDGFVPLGDRDGTLIVFDLLDQQSGRAGMDADRLGNGVGKALHILFSLYDTFLL